MYTVTDKNYINKYHIEQKMSELKFKEKKNV